MQVRRLGRALAILGLALTLAGPAAGDDRTPFIQGHDYGKRFLRAGSEKGQKYRRGLNKMHEEYGPWIWFYAPYEYVPLLSRAWLESRGNPWSHTKDTARLEAGLTSVTYQDAAVVCREWGVCGDPCGDPQLSIAISAYRKFRAHTNMLDATNDEGGPTFWSSWLPAQAADNFYEARCFMGICGSANCAKVRRAVKAADAASGVLTRRGKDGRRHAWWYTLNWLREQTQSVITQLFQPLPKGMSEWRFGTKWGRQVAGHAMRAEFFAPLADGADNHCWPPDSRPYYPHRIVQGSNGDTGEVLSAPIFPEPLHPWKKMPPLSQWRKRCTFYGDKRAWRKAWDPPRRNDRYRRGGLKYHPVDGHPIKVKKGQRKYPTEADWEAALAKWVDERQAEGRLPSDAEYGGWMKAMTEAGCEYRTPTAP